MIGPNGEKNWNTRFIEYFHNSQQHPFVTPTKVELNYMYQYMVSKLSNYIIPTSVYTIEEVISGIQGIKDSLVDNTSPGYPFKSNYDKKKNFLEDPMSTLIIESQWNDWLSDQPFVYPNTMCSKDEILKTEKYKEPKPFYVVDVVTTINGKRLVDDFNEQLGKVPGYYRGKTMYCGGLDETMSRHLKYKHHLPLDHKKYDAHRQPWVSEMMVKLRFHFMKEEFKNSETLTRLISFYSSLDQSETIDLDGNYHKRYGQMLTGSPVTLDDNTLSNDMIFILSCLRIFGKVPSHEKELMGDDTWASLDDYVEPQKWIDAFDSIGYEVTGADKTVNGIYQPIEECEFLKSTPVRYENHWIPKYNSDRLTAILYFRKTDDGTMEQKLNSVLQMSYGSDLYKHLREIIPYTSFRKNLIFDDFRIRKLVFGYESVGARNNITTENKIIINNNKKYQTMATNQIETEILPEETFNNLMSNKQEKEINAGPAENFLAKMIHPPRSQKFDGLPTNDTRSQVTVEYVQQELSIQPAFINGAGSFIPVANATRMAFLKLNGLRVNHVAFVVDDRINVGDGKWYQDVRNTSINRLYNFERNWSSDVQLSRKTYSSHTSTLNATAFNNTGMVSVNQFNPSILFQGVLSEFATEQLQDFIGFAKDMLKSGHYKQISETTEIDSDFEELTIQKRSNSKPRKSVIKNDKYDEQVAKWLQFPKFVRDEIMDKLEVNNLDVDPNSNIQIINFGQIGGAADIVPDASQILTQSTRSFGNPAKEGTFTVYRLNTVTPAWKSSNQRATPTSGLYSCYLNIRKPDGSVFALALYDQTSNATTSTLLDTAWTSDMTVSWTLYEGLTYNNQAAPTNNQSLLIHKFYDGAELQPALQSAFAGMARLAPKPNVMLMQKLMDAFYDQKDSMPARFNFLGTLVKTAGNLFMKHAPTIASKFLGEFGNVSKNGKGKEKEEASELLDMADLLLKHQKGKGGKAAKTAARIEKQAINHHAKSEVKREKRVAKRAAKKEVKKEMTSGAIVTKARNPKKK